MDKNFKKSTSVLTTLALTAVLHLCSFMSLGGDMPSCHAAENVPTEGCCSGKAASEAPVSADNKCCLSTADAKSVERFVQGLQADGFSSSADPSPITAAALHRPRLLYSAAPPGSFFVNYVLQTTCSAHSPPVF